MKPVSSFSLFFRNNLDLASYQVILLESVWNFQKLQPEIVQL